MKKKHIFKKKYDLKQRRGGGVRGHILTTILLQNLNSLSKNLSRNGD